MKIELKGRHSLPFLYIRGFLKIKTKFGIMNKLNMILKTCFTYINMFSNMINIWGKQILNIKIQIFII